MTLSGLQWVSIGPYLDETDDARYRVRKRYDAVTGDWRYDAYQTGPQGFERLLGGFDSNAEARARCSFHAFPSETHFAEAEVVR
ncbi:MAG: hypothetical protein IT178_16490 [Acidobacteria bacterium]|nr:hypothetical protein [Acidobacteriota bacterium]